MTWVRHTWDLQAADLSAPFPSGYSQRSAGPAWKDIIFEIVIASYASDPVWSPVIANIARRMRARIEETISATNADYILVEHAGVPIAVSGVAEQHWTDQNLLTGICVLPSHQRRGVGSALLAASLRWLKDRGVLQARVYTEADSLADRKMYRRFASRRESDVSYPAASSTG